MRKYVYMLQYIGDPSEFNLYSRLSLACKATHQPNVAEWRLANPNWDERGERPCWIYDRYTITAIQLDQYSSL